MWLMLLQILVIFIVNPSFGGISFVCPSDTKHCKCTKRDDAGFSVMCDNLLVEIKQDEYLLFECRNKTLDNFDEMPFLIVRYL